VNTGREAVNTDSVYRPTEHYAVFDAGVSCGVGMAILNYTNVITKCLTGLKSGRARDTRGPKSGRAAARPAQWLPPPVDKNEQNFADHTHEHA